jgi:hypothetical protein
MNLSDTPLSSDNWKPVTTEEKNYVLREVAIMMRDTQMNRVQVGEIVLRNAEEKFSKGGPGSGNFNHGGRPGAVGGSTSGGSGSHWSSNGQRPNGVAPDRHAVIASNGFKYQNYNANTKSHVYAHPSGAKAEHSTENYNTRIYGSNGQLVSQHGPRDPYSNLHRDLAASTKLGKPATSGTGGKDRRADPFQAHGRTAGWNKRDDQAL